MRKTVYYTLNILSNIINDINKEDANIMLKNIIQYYILNKHKKNNYRFLSLEYIEDKINKMINKSCSNNKDIYKESEITNNIKCVIIPQKRIKFCQILYS